MKKSNIYFVLIIFLLPLIVSAESNLDLGLGMQANEFNGDIGVEVTSMGFSGQEHGMEEMQRNVEEIQNQFDNGEINVEEMQEKLGEIHGQFDNAKINVEEIKGNLENSANKIKGNLETIKNNITKGNLFITNVSINSNLNLTGNNLSNLLKIKLSNGRNAELKIMPEVALEKIVQNFNITNETRSNIAIELKEVRIKNETKVAYQVNATKESKLFGFIKTDMKIQTQLDAETGEIISEKKPWWSFLTSN